MLVIYSALVIDAVGIGPIFSILPALLRDVTGVDNVAPDLGVMAALYALMQFFFAPVLGALSDRLGRRPVLLISIAGAAVNYLFLAFAPSLWMLLIGRALAGLTSANASVATASLLHSQQVLHRDRPLDRADSNERRGSDEWQADRFATFFLMPEKQMRKVFLRLFATDQFRITDDTAFGLHDETSGALRAECQNLRGLSRLLAVATRYSGNRFDFLHEQFKVSREAMTIRLEELQ